MALTFIGWSSWEVKLALFEELSLPAPMAWLPKTGIAAAQQQQQQQQVTICLHPLTEAVCGGIASCPRPDWEGRAGHMFDSLLSPQNC